MKRLNKIALSVVAIVAVGIGFSGCADESKAPLVKSGLNGINIYSQDDETIINKMIINGRNGKCNIKDLGAGGETILGIQRVKYLKYGEQITYNEVRLVTLYEDDDKCPPKNGKYEIELKTNFGTYYYEIGE